ncbi:amino acid permease [Evansella cellulosilytica]|uniref:Amino acid permease-associated region n=1 Tax=Evansella cellulosilytica (strain ATCC 21833 / DSM 2522 / FERM P-1141 / JCM 9156 / N-4) TaxID=649639 RepID=E6U0X5_EVAC2|nr:amino acid permease [Evansella cellulosilytica]ADU30287.1 amino acid permease-associated region [Evansella cellulosilytica DSM 2522]
MKSQSKEVKEKPLMWWQLSLLGIACTIGTGFFLGSSIAINMAGPSVVFSFALAAIGTYFVYEALAKMTTADPQKGSFRTYAKKAYGRWAGFSSGWVYWLSEMLITGSQLTALSIFSQFWFPNIPLWIFATGYSVLAIVVIVSGPKGFDRVENLLAVLKASAIVMFIIIAMLALFGVFEGDAPENTVPRTFATLFPNGVTGLLPSLIFGFYGFAGIEIIGLLAMRLKEKSEALKAGKVMLITLGIIYMASIGLALTLVSWDTFTTDESPFVTALTIYNIPYISHIFNGVFIIAGFSTMVASLFAVIRVLVTLAEDKDAPAIFGKKVKNKYAIPALGLTIVGLIVSIVLSLLMPGNIYEYFTTAAGLMLLYNWFFIIGSYGRLHELSTFDNVKRLLGSMLVLAAIVGTLFHETSRPGFFVSIGFIVVIGLVTLLMRQYWKKHPQKPVDPTPKSAFTKIKS